MIIQNEKMLFISLLSQYKHVYIQTHTLFLTLSKTSTRERARVELEHPTYELLLETQYLLSNFINNFFLGFTKNRIHIIVFHIHLIKM